MQHAKLSASGSKKWIPCTRSATLEAQLPDDRSTFAAEGTYGHALFEHRVLLYLRRPTHVGKVAELEGHLEYHSPELADAVEAALERAVERIEHARSVCKDPVILLEQRLDFSPWVPEGFGTGDLVIITDTYIEVLDLKMGKGVAVAAFENSQFRLYMLGAYHHFAALYPVREMRGTVLQPRLGNFGSEVLTVEELLAWADRVVVPAAKLAWAGEGDFVAGSHCSEGFCRARATCAARAEHNMAIAKQDFAMRAPELLTDDQIAAVLAKAGEAGKWLDDVQSYALKQATAHGRKFAGFKLVEGRSNRRYSNQAAVAAALVAAGVPEPLIYERSLLGITAMEKTLGKKKFAEILAGLVEKPAGSPVLVPVSDKREELNSVASAIADFS